MMVLDPSIEPRHPLALEAWLYTMTGNISSLQLAICGSGTYTPDDSCARASDGVEAVANSDISDFLALERKRLLELHRHPDQELGDHPPWL